MLAGTAEWDQHWAKTKLPARVRLFLSGYRAFHRVFKRVLPPHIEEVCEFGCAPGRWLVYFAKRYGARVWGLDISPLGCDLARANLRLCGVRGEIVHGDLASTRIPDSKFDLVYSLGLIEHFDDPLPVLAAHVAAAKVGGLIFVSVPNLIGPLGRLELRLSPDKRRWHNLEIMSPSSLAGLVTNGNVGIVDVGSSGALDPGLLSWSRVLGRVAGRLAYAGSSLVAAPLSHLPTPFASFHYLLLQRKY